MLSPECSPIDPHPLCSSVSKTGCITSAEEDARTAPCVSQAFCSPWHNADHLLLIWGSLSSLQRFFLQTLCEWCKFLHGCGLWGCKHTPYTSLCTTILMESSLGADECLFMLCQRCVVREPCWVQVQSPLPVPFWQLRNMLFSLLCWVKEELSTISPRQGFPYICTLCSSQGPVLLSLV